MTEKTYVYIFKGDLLDSHKTRTFSLAVLHNDMHKHNIFASVNIQTMTTYQAPWLQADEPHSQRDRNGCEKKKPTVGGGSVSRFMPRQ